MLRGASHLPIVQRTFPSVSLIARKMSSSASASVTSLQFDNSCLRCLPVDEEPDNYTRQVHGACFSRVSPTPCDRPQLVCASDKALGLIDLGPGEIVREGFASYFSGNMIIPGSQPAAHCYCGHQFGHFSGQLGDGATMYLGEVTNAKGDKWEIQFKGAGKTPYSRSADGRKVLRSSIREFLCSEHINALGIPTTRAGTCVTSNSRVVRDIFYNGNAIHERATIILRMAKTFIRFGSFEIFKATDRVTGRKGPSTGRVDILTALVNFVIRSYYPHLYTKHYPDATSAAAIAPPAWEDAAARQPLKEELYQDFFKKIVTRTAKLVAEWQCVGWCHGVLNTDNMSIIGDTIDYGPYGFMERYDPNYVCNASDDQGRYAYKNQPDICKWNCEKLAEALSPLLEPAAARAIIAEYDGIFKQRYIDRMREKLGLIRKKLDDDKQLIDSLLDTMHRTGADFTVTFRSLRLVCISRAGDERFAAALDCISANLATCQDMIQASKPSISPNQLGMFMQLAETQPMVLEALGLSAEQLQKWRDEYQMYTNMQSWTQGEKDAQDRRLWHEWMSKYCDRLAADVSGEGDDNVSSVESARVAVMDAANPKVVLRNHVAQRAIDKAEQGDFSEVRRLLAVLETPFDESHSDDDALPRPPGSSPLLVT
ncbi:unnamed protein product [Vitrella brassicaformis CCMP3155]|uniref:Selenoprotein O n=1 Tax=Vitrella brassicaformis (strain CCMP3155) TaxID=1169540 RepID=A0A0G4GNH7_VITBC|nr:unnamed protein product [Vitrella brassicaformis CCMP3155]|mmetsp:Transcript_18688/g.44973  ORF Transcript_18688/g.44973 Transcript_18688/m.44973 type:complete len:654 (-) Transcript_18688:629-2590(-)|eukprot:CEM31827.1 unnamed protein product [Vitrella brassicaformis CCMP3155]